MLIMSDEVNEQNKMMAANTQYVVPEYEKPEKGV